MRRVIHHMLLGLLVFGLIGPLTTYTWKLAARSTETAEETQESLDKDFTLSRIIARLSGTRRLPPCPAPREVSRARHDPRARVLPPAQVITPERWWCGGPRIQSRKKNPSAADRAPVTPDVRPAPAPLVLRRARA